MVVNPLQIDSPGAAGPIRDLVAKVDRQGRILAEVRATARTGQAMPSSPAPIMGVRSRGLAGAGVSIPTDAWTWLQWPASVAEHGTAVGAPSGSTLSAAVAGVYAWSARVHWVAGGVAPEPREMRVVRNGAPLAYASTTTAAAVTLALADTVVLAAGDVLAVEVLQRSGGPLQVYGVPAFSGFSLAFMQEVS